jgi:membrane protein YdbS with pleckstrin-like domain
MTQTPPAGAPTEETRVWEGRPSQWTNMVPFLLCLLVVPIPYAIYRWLAVKCTTYTLSTQRLRIAHGILSRHFDNLELYRVRDLTVAQPFLLRMAGLGNIALVTSDSTTPVVVLPAIASPLEVHDIIRDEVQRMRRERGVRELDVHDDAGGSILH